MKQLSLYIHVPFCTRRCAYCSFYHVRTAGTLEASYIVALEREIARELAAVSETTRLCSVFVGGGTPSVLSRGSLKRLFSAVTPWRDEEITREVTVELNPEDVTPDLVRFLRDQGVDRISLGIQSMDARALAVLKRCSADDNRQAAQTVRSVFDNVSFDVLLAVPGMARRALESSLEELIALRPEHFSVYCLEPGGDMSHAVERFFDHVDPDHAAEEYLWVCERLASENYVHYEVSNFARDGRESVHNRVYWNGGEYIGVGPAAHSMVDGRRYHNSPSVNDYTAADGPTRVYDDGVDPELERFMLGLRTSEGVPVGWCRCPDQVVADLAREGLLGSDAGRVRLTDRGFLVLNEILCRLLPDKDAATSR